MIRVGLAAVQTSGVCADGGFVLAMRTNRESRFGENISLIKVPTGELLFPWERHGFLLVHNDWGSRYLLAIDDWGSRYLLANL